MDLAHSTSREATWSMVRIMAMVALVVGLMVWHALTITAPSHSTVVSAPRVTPGDLLLDRGAERLQYGPISRVGGPGGEIGDAPIPTAGQ